MKLAGNKIIVLTAVLFTGKWVSSKVKCFSRAEGGKECCHGDLTSDHPQLDHLCFQILDEIYQD